MAPTSTFLHCSAFFKREELGVQLGRVAGERLAGCEKVTVEREFSLGHTRCKLTLSVDIVYLVNTVVNRILVAHQL